MAVDRDAIWCLVHGPVEKGQVGGRGRTAREKVPAARRQGCQIMLTDLSVFQLAPVWQETLMA